VMALQWQVALTEVDGEDMVAVRSVFCCMGLSLRSALSQYV
jgi:hypothetical protein